MSVYAVSFRIHEDSTYQTRYASFTAQLQQGSKTHWDETTSFALVETDETIDGFCSRIYVYSGFDSSKDLYLVLYTNKLSARVRGSVKYPHTLQSLLPYLVKL